MTSHIFSSIRNHCSFQITHNSISLKSKYYSYTRGGCRYSKQPSPLRHMDRAHDLMKREEVDVMFNRGKLWFRRQMIRLLLSHLDATFTGHCKCKNYFQHELSSWALDQRVLIVFSHIWFVCISDLQCFCIWPQITFMVIATKFLFICKRSPDHFVISCKPVRLSLSEQFWLRSKIARMQGKVAKDLLLNEWWYCFKSFWRSGRMVSSNYSGQHKSLLNAELLETDYTVVWSISTVWCLRPGM